MDMKYIISFLVAIAFASVVQGQYKAAVVEYSPIIESSPNATVERNLEEYIHYIETAKANAVQIIVFPEYGLTGLIEDPTEYAIEIPSINNGTVFQNYWLQKLSNAANEHSLYIVINLLEKARNENNDTIYYNTNIVFDVIGQIVAKYRKINLFFEPKITPGNETVTFTTDFGITFGIFTCFDIMYYNPSKAILNSSVTDIIFPTAWTSVLPFYHSLSIQSGYSQANQVNLLAADFNSPSQGLGGSGIYRHDGIIDTYYISGISSSKLEIADLYPRGTPRDAGSVFSTFGFDILNASKSELKNFISVRDFQASNYAFKQLELSATTESQDTLCFGSFCCNFTISASAVTASEVYQLLVYNGPTKLGDSMGNIRLCTLVSCESSDLNTCGSRNVTLTTRFSKISITGNFETEADHFYQPVTLTTGLLPVFNTTYTSEVTNQTIAISFSSTTTVDNLVVFGVLGRGGASTFGSSVVFLVVISLLKYMF
ncbi:vanin-like protein 1 [Anoplophora glabripennis]|uniref:vanin-like protein 1 n=1 Tax=Anoplophora glabripennis TaxID=217634 RepID=UPI0008736E0A|nr:vanin-like protein 1 [Anoplophora glabripennis]